MSKRGNTNMLQIINESLLNTYGMSIRTKIILGIQRFGRTNETDAKRTCKYIQETRTIFSGQRPIIMKDRLKMAFPRFVTCYHELLAARNNVNLQRVQPFTILINKIIDGWYNRYSEKAVKNLGPQLACARWLLRCAAEFRVEGSKEFVSTKARLKSLQPNFSIEEVDLTDSCVSGPGFKHFSNLDTIKAIRCVHCGWVDDDGMALLIFSLRNSLEKIEIVSCGSISGAGLVQLQHLTNVKDIQIGRLPLVREGEKKILLDVLRVRLGSRCNISYPDFT